MKTGSYDFRNSRCNGIGQWLKHSALNSYILGLRSGHAAISMQMRVAHTIPTSDPFKTNIMLRGPSQREGQVPQSITKKDK